MPNTEDLKLDGPRVHLRLAVSTDISEIIRYYRDNDDHFEQWDPVRPADFFTESWWAQRLTRDHLDFGLAKALHLFVFAHDAPQTVIGSVNFNDMQRGVAYYCNVGYGLAEAQQGQGLMREALETALPYVFGSHLQMHRIQANYMPHNRRSGGLLRRLGFVVEGYARDYLFLNGRWEDHVLTSLTNPDWQPSA